MKENKHIKYIKEVLKNTPEDWLKLTTHRLDIYNEKLAKSQFLEHFENLFKNNDASEESLSQLPTAFDYIRLGHPLSCLLEWVIANINNLEAENVIGFSSKTTPILAILRKNLLDNKKTNIVYESEMPNGFDAAVIRDIYGYNFDLVSLDNYKKEEGTTSLLIAKRDSNFNNVSSRDFDFILNTHGYLGSIILVNGEKNKNYIPEIQHVRRRETIAMTPANCLTALNILADNKTLNLNEERNETHKANVVSAIQKVTASHTKALVASSGLSIQYAILMGLIDDAHENHKGKSIKLIVPPNCYGGTNDQARRVAACIENVGIVDLPVDGGNDMVQGIELVLSEIAAENAVPYIIAEIPTNPRVEVPELISLRDALSKERKTSNGEIAVAPVFILDQTFCPNVHFLGEGEILADVKTISFSSGSKFPSGGLCTAGYCIGNTKTVSIIEKIEKHLLLCDNEATELQYEILARQMPTMIQRIADAYKNTREFVSFIKNILPAAKINFVSEELASQGFTPSVFSLDLPTKGDNEEERETYKRALNHKLINLMITEIPNESKYCVSYGQLKGCYWTIPATSTQGTTKEGDKDYIARVALSANMDLELHKKVFTGFCNDL